MTKSDFRKLLGSPGRDPGCDAGIDVIDEYCEAVHRGDPLSNRYTEFLTHLSNCTACREDTESLLAVLRELEKSSKG
jgi:NADH:ubiquinone oxidoreductase subunit F (NADH-binding)